MVQCCDVAVLRCCSAAVLQCCSGVVLQCCGVAVLQCCDFAVLRCCSAAMLQCCGVAMLQCCGVAVLQCCSAVLFQLCNAQIDDCTCIASSWKDCLLSKMLMHNPLVWFFKKVDDVIFEQSLFYEQLFTSTVYRCLYLYFWFIYFLNFGWRLTSDGSLTSFSLGIVWIIFWIPKVKWEKV